MDSTRRTLLTTGAAAAAMAAAPNAFAQAAVKEGSAGKFYQKGNVRIHYQAVGSGVPLPVIPGGGQNSTIAWSVTNAPFHAFVIAMESAMLAPKSEVSMYPRKDTKDKIQLAVRQVRTFLRAHRPATA